MALRDDRNITEQEPPCTLDDHDHDLLLERLIKNFHRPRYDIAPELLAAQKRLLRKRIGITTTATA